MHDHATVIVDGSIKEKLMSPRATLLKRHIFQAKSGKDIKLSSNVTDKQTTRVGNFQLTSTEFWNFVVSYEYWYEKEY